jgi:transcriptional regulator with XRE-family HTH domain
MMTRTEIPDVVRDFGRQLREAREEHQLTLEEAARRADLPPEHLRDVGEGYPKLHGGRTHGPTLAKLERVANVYGLSVRLVRA